MLIDDLQWADANLVEFLAGVPEAARNTPLLLVCTARPDFFESHPMWGAGQRNAVTVRLEPLDAEATAELLDELLADGNLDEETREMVEDRCGGTFNNIEDVIPRADLAAHAEKYKRLSGFSIEVLNAQPPILGPMEQAAE